MKATFRLFTCLNRFRKETRTKSNLYRQGMNGIQIVVCLIFLGSTVATQAQISGLNDMTTTPIPGAGHNYVQDMNETVNPANGSLSVRIRIPVEKMRGLNWPFSIGYDSSGTIFASNPAQSTPFWAGSQGWSYLTLPTLNVSTDSAKVNPDDRLNDCNYYHGFVFSDPTGARHVFAHLLSKTWVTNSNCGLENDQLTDTADKYQAVLTGGGPGEYVLLYITGPDGTVYYFAALGGFPTWVEDRNGNKITISSSPASTNPPYSVSSTLGGNAISTTLSGSTGTIAVQGLGHPYGITTREVDGTGYPVNLTVLPPSNEGITQGCATLEGSAAAKGSVISTLTLPDDLSYTFGYDSVYGLLNQIIYPTGAEVDYVWGSNPQSGAIASSYQWWEYEAPPYAPILQDASCYTRFDTPAIQSRIVKLNGQKVLEQDFYYQPTQWGDINGPTPYIWTSKETKLVTHDYVDGTSFETDYTYGPGYMPPVAGSPAFQTNEIPLEQTIVYRDAGGTVLKTVQKTWRDLYSLASEQDILNDGTTSQTAYQYGTLDQIQEKDEYDYGQTTTPTRITHYIYQGIGTGIHDAPGFQLPSQIIVCNGIAGAGNCTSTNANRVAETDYTYDQGTVFPMSAVNHDDINYSADVNTRGNVTTETRKCFPGCSDSMTNYAYDQTGQPTSMTDTEGNITYYSFADNFADGDPYGNSNAYLTKITRPPTNGVSHITNYQYAFSNGQLTQTTDENNQVTTYSYAGDPWNRLKEVDYPVEPGNGGLQPKTLYSYADSGPSPSVTTTQTINPSTSMITETVMDELMRPTKTQMTDPGYGTVSTDTTYDGRGNVVSVSNPYRSTSDPTYGVTRYSYDELSRKKTQTNPDSTTEGWGYNGDAVTFTNELNNSWAQTYDSFGRLTQVVEPSGGTTAVYAYDNLNNLRSVTQGAESRSFVYDSLSRLTAANNPESGTVSYNYDLNSNVHMKTDARDISTTYSYDVLNRLTGKTYSDSTYPVSYSYDMSTGPSPTNTKGRLTDEKTMVQGETMTERAIDQYDPMGRVLSERQCFLGGCVASAYTLTYSYDLAGNVVGSNNGVAGTNAAAFVYSYDGADRLNCVSTVNCTQPGTLFQATGYNAIGLTNANYATPVGGTAAFSQTLAYDKRMRLTGETDAATNPTSGMPYSYTVGYDATGNVTSVNDSLMGTWTYTPDTLNRLNTATATAGVYSGLTLTESYDAYGNRTNQVPSGSYGGPVPSALLLTFNNGKNRVDQWAYDAAGDVINDTSNMYAYDAEGHQTAAVNSVTGLTGYIYDAEGRRVEKVQVNGWNTPHPTTVVENEYLLGLGGEQVTVLGQNAAWQWTNVYAGGKQLATYDSAGTHFTLTDWLGTKRMQLSEQISGSTAMVTVGEQCTSLPYGDGLSCTGSDVNQLHYTGKERDQESTNDYFESRYYASNIGARFLTPDDGSDQDPSDPQSWNLYSYARNNPLRNTDPTGNACVDNGNGGTYDDASGGESCADVANSPQVVSATVTAQAGNAVGSFLLNSAMALSNMAGDYFAAFTGLRAYQNDPLANDYTGKTANYAAQAALFMVGPEGEAGEAGEAINITERGIQHVLERHVPGGAKAATDKSLFKAGSDVKALIKAAESVSPTTNAVGNLERIVDAGTTVGKDRATGQATSVYTVVTKPNGELVTAFPGRP